MNEVYLQIGYESLNDLFYQIAPEYARRFQEFIAISEQDMFSNIIEDIDIVNLDSTRENF